MVMANDLVPEQCGDGLEAHARLMAWVARVCAADEEVDVADAGGIGDAIATRLSTRCAVIGRPWSVEEVIGAQAVRCGALEPLVEECL